MKLEPVKKFQFSGLEIFVVKFTRQTLNFPKEFVARWWGKKKTLPQVSTEKQFYWMTGSVRKL
jgi:hypothetical protein